MIEKVSATAEATALDAAELENFVNVVRRIRPRSPGIRLGGIDIFGSSTFLAGAAGGDHIVYLDFDQRYAGRL